MVNIFQAGMFFSKYFPNKYIVSCVLRGNTLLSLSSRGRCCRDSSVCFQHASFVPRVTLYVCPVQCCQQMEGDFPFHIRNHVWRHKWGTLGITFNYSSDALCSRTKFPNYSSGESLITLIILRVLSLIPLDGIIVFRDIKHPVCDVEMCFRFWISS